MKHTLVLLTLVAASTALAQIAPGNTNVAYQVGIPTVYAQFDAAQSNQVRSLWLENYALSLAAWQSATNANPTYASSNAAPVRLNLGVYVQNTFKDLIAPMFNEKFNLMVAQYNCRQNENAKVRFAQTVAAIMEALPYMTAGQVNTITNICATAMTSAGN